MIEVGEICDRYGSTNRAGAAIATAVLEDFRIVTKDDQSHVIDQYKLRRKRAACRLKAESGPGNMPTILETETLYFDGRKDKNYEMIQKGGRCYRKIIVEEHITIITESDSNFITHITQESSTVKGISESIIDYYARNNLDIGQHLGIGCDGTATNTGVKKGCIIRLLELKLSKPLQRIPCQLHANELPLRHLTRHLDGKTTGLEGFSGPIGSDLVNCEQLPIVKFTAIADKFPELTCSELSTDQIYLYEICQSIIMGPVAKNLGDDIPA